MASNTQQPDLQWFTSARLGMFIHWGLYSLPARHEWVMSKEKIPADEYERYMQYFNPDLYDPVQWAKDAKAAGIKYVVLTTKHHEGFALWDTQVSDYNIINSPFGKDALRMFVDAMRAEGLHVGFYHSLIDWHHPDFTIDGFHPDRDRPDREERNKGRDMAKYREFLHAQVRELLTNYGKIHYLFFDFSYREDWPDKPEKGGKGRDDWASEKLLDMVRTLQPGIVVNDRLDIPGDIVTPEGYQPTKPMERDGREVVWEACQTLNGSWGYDRDNHDYKSVPLLVRMLVDTVSNNGNILLNVGPTARGNFDANASKALSDLADWMSVHSRSIYGCGHSSLTPPKDVRYTQSGKRLFVHVFAWPFEFMHLPGLAGKVAYAQLLHDASEIKIIQLDAEAPVTSIHMRADSKDTLTLKLPIREPGVAVPVIELFLK
ncbi:alpha-L-fucosidase domain-containing protein [Pochonia chlamydosporia 170]|uniref:alpha-L-fucosidase n=1 Tax=Pochonia chlamydosporia 170 TaxID=1380566 RepID=A0A179EY89_METCM|nr:alpha-L-fucosidase domain-containing protein [Pochonia chlamydosporia 170]OAQ57869.1 alpha-L-fucosidase domain-containing protein [Pochonia chlamydosporia 170]